MSYQTAMMKRQLLRALEASGQSMTMTITRTEKDLNGMPTGETITVCTLRGMRYQNVGNMASLMLLIGGVTAGNQSAPQIMGVLLTGSAPQIGDHATYPDGSGGDVVSAQVTRGAIVSLVVTR